MRVLSRLDAPLSWCAIGEQPHEQHLEPDVDERARGRLGERLAGTPIVAPGHRHAGCRARPHARSQHRPAGQQFPRRRRLGRRRDVAADRRRRSVLTRCPANVEHALATPLLREQPDWDAAAQALIDGCITLATPELKVRFLDRVCLTLGDRLYPAFLRLLCVVNDEADDAGKRAVVHTLTHALSTGRLPSGRLQAWGGHGSGANAWRTTSRSLGPIEYLCAWRGRHEDELGMPDFQAAAHSVISLVTTDDEASALYRLKLRQDIDDPLGGALSRSTRAALAELVDAWEGGAPVEHLVHRLTLHVGEAEGAGLSALQRMPLPLR